VWAQREPSGRYEKDTGPQALAYAERVAPDRAASAADLDVGIDGVTPGDEAGTEIRE
jgi:hypothetical protein